MNHAEGSLEALIQKSLGCNKFKKPKKRMKSRQKGKPGVVKTSSVQGKGGAKNTKIDNDRQTFC
jgi:hypothetical protein